MEAPAASSAPRPPAPHELRKALPASSCLRIFTWRFPSTVCRDRSSSSADSWLRASGTRRSLLLQRPELASPRRLMAFSLDGPGGGCVTALILSPWALFPWTSGSQNRSSWTAPWWRTRSLRGEATGTITCPQAGCLPFSLLTHSRFYSLNKHFSALCLASCGPRQQGLGSGSQELTGL